MFKYILTVLAIYFGCESGAVSFLHKCDFTDGNCKAALYRSIVRSLSGGVPDKGIPPLDPLGIPEVEVDLPDSTKLIIVKSQLLGMKDCTVSDFHTVLEKKFTSLKITCHVKVNGEFLVKGGPGHIDGRGKGEINLGTITAKAYFPFTFIKRSDGEVYMVCDRHKVTHSYDAPDDIKVTDDFGLGEKNAKIILLLEQNSNVIKNKLLPISLEQSLEFYHAFADKFLGSIPVKAFINTDLSQYIQ